MSQVKGAGPKTTLKWIEKNYGAEGLKKVLDGCPPALKRTLEVIITSQWYPTMYADAICLSFAESGLAGTGLTLNNAFRLLGKFIAEDNLSTLYSIVLKFTKPDTMANLLPRMWTTYFRDITVEVQAESEGPGTATCKIKGIGDFHYISPLAAGWIEFAYKKVGAQYIGVHELNYRQDFTNPEELVYKIKWR